jgi:hypothetical protein
MSTMKTTTICEICGQAGGVIKSYLVGEPHEREAWAHAECLDVPCASGGVIGPHYVGEYDECEGCARPKCLDAHTDDNGGAQQGPDPNSGRGEYGNLEARFSELT